MLLACQALAAILVTIWVLWCGAWMLHQSEDGAEDVEHAFSSLPGDPSMPAPTADEIRNSVFGEERLERIVISVAILGGVTLATSTAVAALVMPGRPPHPDAPRTDDGVRD